ncbi:DUF72 domain-containing protein [Solimonas fluminis]|uniref:DUF72 domain-containing protein n=1 Tax=Solimonas fluminis TaxID=2086571 RepID=A0A2S5TAV8_9GAMM|nr:DUF72 domain-containing protein [Solimonas fluminis]
MNMGKTTGRIRIGISGWRYAPWRGVFYPQEFAQKRELEYASRQFPSIELNGSFYSLQKPRSYARWHRDTPEGFVFSVKANRYITHIRRLRGVRQEISNFLASGLFALGDKLGPMLWQLPPSLRYDEGLLEDFLALLPRDAASASALARRRGPLLSGRAKLAAPEVRFRHALEVRHGSFEDEAFLRQLRRHNVAVVFADTAGKWPYIEELTADFVYLRLHGDEELYTSGYTDEALRRWARRIRKWSGGSRPRDVYCYFDNDAKVCAPRDARALMKLLRLEWKPEES